MAPLVRAPSTWSTAICSWGRRSTRQRINVATKLMLLHSKSQIHRRLSGWPPRFWLVRWFRRPVRCWSKEDDKTHTPIVLRWRSFDLGGRGSPIRARRDAWCREHGWRCSSIHSWPSTTTRPFADGHACPIIGYVGWLTKTTAGSQQIGASVAARVVASWSTRYVRAISE